jgi:predicted DNA-binding transcriptional regulator AlpA
MDQPTPKTSALDSTLLVTLTVEQLRELLIEAIHGAKTAQQDTERWLDAKEAAEMLSMSEDWLYRHAKNLPFARKLGPKMLRFSYQGLIKWMATRKVS